MPLLKSDEQVIKEESEKVQEYVKSGDLASAKEYLTNITISEKIREEGTSKIVEIYDAMFFTAINAFVKKGDFDEAEELASIYRSKICNDYSWVDSSCYRLLYAKSESEDN